MLALVTTPNGDLFAGGDFFAMDGQPANYVARWNGSNWSTLGAGLGNSVRALAVLPDGDLVAGGAFTTAGGAPANRIARWNGTSWSTFGTGLDASVGALAVHPLGTLWVGGPFRIAGGLGSTNYAVLGTTCPAITTVTGAGCAGSGGNNALRTTAPAWVDSTFRARGSELPGFAFVVAVTGLSPLSPSFALDTVFSQALPGCALHVMPDVLQLLTSVNNRAESSLFLPNTPPLVGASFHHQMLCIEVDPNLVFLQVTATNALQLTVGNF